MVDRPRRHLQVPITAQSRIPRQILRGRHIRPRRLRERIHKCLPIRIRRYITAIQQNIRIGC